MVNTHLYFPEDLYGEITLLAQEEGKPVAQVIRELVTHCLGKKVSHTTKGKRNRENPFDWLGSFDLKGPRDVSVNHDKYLYDE